jgi:hypothetical protein
VENKFFEKVLPYMSQKSDYFSKLIGKAQGSDEERQVATILYNDNDISMNDKRLNSVAALTWNSQSCSRIFALLEKAIIPTENPWKVMYKALLLIHTCLLYGSELAVDKCINCCKYIYPLQDYNSAMVKRGFFSSAGTGTDYGAPVRAASTQLVSILGKDEHIRQARSEARAGHDSLIPLGEETMEQINPSKGLQMQYGQALTSSVGAGHSLENVPGMYQGRPERFFDDYNDSRNRTTAGNSQITRDVGFRFCR